VVQLKLKPTGIVKQIVQNTTIRKYTRCHSVENIQEVIGPRDRIILVQETKTIIKKAPLLL